MKFIRKLPNKNPDEKHQDFLGYREFVIIFYLTFYISLLTSDFSSS